MAGCNGRRGGHHRRGRADHRGSQIPAWSGAKADPRALGLLTVLLSALALLAALRQSRLGLTTGLRGLAALALLVPGLLCLTTVGRLWYLPGLLIISAGILTVDSWTDTASVVRQNWLRCLLSGLGACQLLMAAGSTGVVSLVGVGSGIALIAAAFWPNPQRWALLGLIIIGTVPFAALAWTALVPVLVVLVTAAVAVPLVRETGPAGRPG